MSDDAAWPFPEPIDTGEVRHLTPGLRLPNVPLVATEGGNVDLAKRTGRTVVFCYPWMGGPGLTNPAGWDDIAGAHGSTPQAEAYRRYAAEFQGLGVGVYGLSQQVACEQRAAAKRLQLPFALLCDDNGTFQQQFRLPQFSDAEGRRYLCRLTMLVEDGVLKRVWYPVHPPPSDAQTVLMSLQ